MIGYRVLRRTAGLIAGVVVMGSSVTSAQEHPVHTYAVPGKFVVKLEVDGPDGCSALSKVWDVSFSGDPQK